ncbi:hypothetical protein EDC04DRAFT_2603169 [Pisolithus marmoratus]|nr:hypothetical protein EDC04DRAFT_2603169 [Pisolithus marmoratus]
MYQMDGKRGDGWERGEGEWASASGLEKGRGGNYLEGGLGWWWLVLEELDGRRGQRGRAREGGAYPPVIADVAVLGGLLLALEAHLVKGQQQEEVGVGTKEMLLCVHACMGENFNFSQSHH